MSWTKVQTLESDTVSGSATSWPISFAGAVGSGNLVVGQVLLYAGGTLTSITDDKSNTYTVLDSNSNIANQSSNGYNFVLGNITNAPTTLTFHITGGLGFYMAVMEEFSSSNGATAANPVDVHSLKNDTTGVQPPATVTSNSVTTTQAGDLIWGAIITPWNTITTQSGFTASYNGNGTNALFFMALEYETQGGAGAITAAFNFTGSSGSFQTYGLYIVALKEPAALSQVPYSAWPLLAPLLSQ